MKTTGWRIYRTRLFDLVIPLLLSITYVDGMAYDTASSSFARSNVKYSSVSKDDNESLRRNSTEVHPEKPNIVNPIFPDPINSPTLLAQKFAHEAVDSKKVQDTIHRLSSVIIASKKMPKVVFSDKTYSDVMLPMLNYAPQSASNNERHGNDKAINRNGKDKEHRKRHQHHSNQYHQKKESSNGSREGLERTRNGDHRAVQRNHRHGASDDSIGTKYRKTRNYSAVDSQSLGGRDSSIANGVYQSSIPEFAKTQRSVVKSKDKPARKESMIAQLMRTTTRDPTKNGTGDQGMEYSEYYNDNDNPVNSDDAAYYDSAAALNDQAETIRLPRETVVNDLLQNRHYDSMDDSPEESSFQPPRVSDENDKTIGESRRLDQKFIRSPVSSLESSGDRFGYPNVEDFGSYNNRDFRYLPDSSYNPYGAVDPLSPVYYSAVGQNYPVNWPNQIPANMLPLRSDSVGQSPQPQQFVPQNYFPGYFPGQPSVFANRFVESSMRSPATGGWAEKLPSDSVIEPMNEISDLSEDTGTTLVSAKSGSSGRAGGISSTSASNSGDLTPAKKNTSHVEASVEEPTFLSSTDTVAADSYVNEVRNPLASNDLSESARYDLPSVSKSKYHSGRRVHSHVHKKHDTVPKLHLKHDPTGHKITTEPPVAEMGTSRVTSGRNGERKKIVAAENASRQNLSSTTVPSKSEQRRSTGKITTLSRRQVQSTGFKNETKVVASEILNEIVAELEELKLDHPNNAQQEGLPCKLTGTWVTTRAGVLIDMKLTGHGIKVLLAKLTPPVTTTEGLLNVTWNVTGFAPFRRGGPFTLLATNNHTKNLAVFVGACKVCQGIDTIEGSWTVSHEPRDCRDFQMSINTFNEIFRRTRLYTEIKEKQLEHEHSMTGASNNTSTTSTSTSSSTTSTSTSPSTTPTSTSSSLSEANTDAH